MADLEGITRRLLKKGVGKQKIIEKLMEEILFYKSISKEKALKLANAVLFEVENSMKSISNQFLSELLNFPMANVSMGDQGVGCRGAGDFEAHRKIAEVVITTGVEAYLDPRNQDDAGVVKTKKGDFLVVSVDGMHSRLSEFPFLAGFHATRATLRDTYVKGAKPIALLVDLHLADDADVSRLFEFMSGCAVVSELSKIPIITGSTLRIGGDMVIGDRLTGCVGSVGISDGQILARRKIQPSDLILMTEGAGGGTICTTAIYSGNFDVVLETLNLQFIKTCDIIFNSIKLSKINAATDWTNGGLRGDANEICKEANVGLEFYEERIRGLLNRKVLKMLEELNIDYLGVSMDALLIFVPPRHADEIIGTVRENGVSIDIVGKVIKTPSKGFLISDGAKIVLTPLFRESAYTQIKRVVGEKSPENVIKMRKNVNKVKKMAIEKARLVSEFIKQNNSYTTGS